MDDSLEKFALSCAKAAVQRTRPASLTPKFAKKFKATVLSITFSSEQLLWTCVENADLLADAFDSRQIVYQRTLKAEFKAPDLFQSHASQTTDDELVVTIRTNEFGVLLWKCIYPL
jgi:hypothetical protein